VGDVPRRPRDPGPGERTNTIGHTVERMLQASARDILDALEKGKLAELFMSRHLDDLVRAGAIVRYQWRDLDAVPDFLITLVDGTTRTIEVKNVRSGGSRLRVQTQKTRASRGDPMSRYYRVDQFDIIAPCLFNAMGRWTYLFARSSDLRRLANDPSYLATMQDVSAAPGTGLALDGVPAIWHAELIELLA